MTDEVRLRIHGLMPEKLIERARELGVSFQTIRPLGDHEIIVGVSAADAERLRGLCERFSIPCVTLSRRGKSALTQALARRWTLLIGLGVAIAVCWAFLGHIWRVDIAFTGDAAALGKPEVVRAALTELDIRPGMGRDIDVGLLCDELSARLEGYSYFGARLEGVRLLIEAAPEAVPPAVYDVGAARDLYADRGGIVVSVNVEAGEPCVKPGDTVRRGQLLIRGEEKVSKEDSHAIAALGQVLIRAWFEGSAEMPTLMEHREFTGRVSAASTLMTPWFEVPILAGETFESQTEQTDMLPIGGLFLPVRIERVTRRETRVKTQEGDTDALRGRLAALALADARARLFAEGPAEYEIARCWTREHPIEDNTLRVSAVCEIITNTAVTTEALHQGG